MNLTEHNIKEIDNFLTPTESIIFMMRFGFAGPKRTLKQCADLFQVSSTRICHIQQKAIKKLYHPTVPQFIRDFALKIAKEKHDKEIKTMKKYGYI